MQTKVDVGQCQQASWWQASHQNTAYISPFADKIASKLSDSMMSALDLSGNAVDGVGD